MGVPAWYIPLIAVVVATSYFIFIIANVHSETLNYWKGSIMKEMSNAVRIFGYRVESLNNKIDNKTEITLNKSSGRRIFIQSTLNRKESTNDKK
jgi:hypothetical protein